ncbi:MAG: hypothetical protein ABSE73_16480, partial [Planctomycetota bacterium]
MAVKGVRHPVEIAGLRLSQRMLVRLGVLLKKGLALSVPVLESAPPGSALESLLLDPLLPERAAALDTGGVRQLAQDRPGAAGVLLSVVTAEDGVRVLRLQEELEAEEVWSATAPAARPSQPEQPPPAAETVADLPAVEQNALAVRLGSPAATAIRGAGHWSSRATGEGGLFGPAEIEGWRLKLAASGAAAERMEALRTLALAPLSPREKMDVLRQGLSDKDPAVRAEAAGLLPGLGAAEDVAAALAGLSHADPSRRAAAVERLLKLLGGVEPKAGSGGTELEIGSAAVSALTMLRCQSDGALTGQLLDVLCACAPAVGRSPERAAEIVRVIAGLLSAAAKRGSSSREVAALLTPALRLVRVLAVAAGQTLLPVLQEERERCTDQLTESFLLQATLDLPAADAEAEQRLLVAAVNYLGRETEEGRDSRAVGSRLARRGEQALAALAEGFAAGHPGAQRYFLILFDDICRLHKVAPGGLEQAAQVVLRTIETGSKAMRMAAMECRFITSLDVPEQTRCGLAKAFLDHIADFTFRSEIEKAEATL